MSASLECSGNFNNTERYLKKLASNDAIQRLDQYGQLGAAALSSATPTKTGKTAASWTYEIEQSDQGATIHWLNTNMNNGVNIAVILQYGHGTGTGGYVVGRDYINPAIQPVFDDIAESASKEIASI